MRDFWAVYTGNLDAIRAELLAVVAKMPQLSQVVARMTPEMHAEQEKISLQAMRQATLDGDWGPILELQRQNGATYAAMGVTFTEWFDVCTAFMRVITPIFVREFGNTERLTDALHAMNIYIDTVMAEVGEEYVRAKERVIVEQHLAIQELSTPVLRIRDQLLLLPIVGVVDTQRARHMTEHLLHSIRTHRARVVVMDITGVPAVDSKVANHLFQTVAAARLMGARVVVTGLSAEVAQALVTLGVDVDQLHTVGDLQGGLEEADRLLQTPMLRPEPAPPRPPSPART